jgi:hypothetical protein
MHTMNRTMNTDGPLATGLLLLLAIASAAILLVGRSL